MSEKKVVPLYQSRRDQVAGVAATLKPGDSAGADHATWLVQADSLGGLVPRPGDRMRTTDGEWWKVTAVGPLAGGAYPCLCDREPKGGDS